MIKKVDEVIETERDEWNNTGEVEDFDAIAQRIVDDNSDELNPAYEPAGLKSDIATELRKAASYGRTQ